MSMFRGLLDVRPEERRNTFAAFGTLVAITTGHTLLETARDALFLSKLPAAELPWMYLIIVVIALALAQLGRASGRGLRADHKAGVIGSLLVASVVTAAFWALSHKGATQRWVLYALYVWTGLFASWVMVQFWTLLGRAHTMTQAKRLYGFIGGGAVLGGVVGAVGARVALTMTSPRAVLLLAALLFAIAALPCALVRTPTIEPEAESTTSSAPKRDSMAAGFALLWENAFARRVLGIAFVATVTVTLADFLFKSEISAAYGDDMKGLAKYVSTFYAITNTLSLVAQLVVAPWIFRALGVQRALFFFPVAMAMAAGGVLVTGGALGAAVLMKGLDGTLRYSLHRTSTELLLVPVPDGTRERVKPMVDLIGSRGGQAGASLAILALVAVGAAGDVTVGAIILLLAVLWLALVVSIRRLYLDVFRETLRTGGLSGRAELPELDLGALETLFAGLNSNRDNEVLASLELLAEQHRERLIPALILYHPSRDVVLRALEIFTVRGRTDFASIADRLNGHPDREIAAAALRARTAVLPDRRLLRQRLTDSCPQVAVTALVALMARDWIDPKDADARIEAVLKTRSWQTAAELARAVRDIAGTRGTNPTFDERFDSLLVRLARQASSFGEEVECSEPIRPSYAGYARELSPEINVRLETARAMEARRSPEFLPVLVGMLSRHELRATARSAIVAIPGALEFLDNVMENAELARNVRVHVPRTIAYFEPDAAAHVLLPRLLTERDGAVRFKILRALVKLHRANPSLRLEEAVLRRALETNLDHAEELRRWGLALSRNEEGGPGGSTDPLRAVHHLLVDLVRDKETHALQRTFLLLELLQGEDFDDIERGLRSKNPKTYASSLELIENLVRPPFRGRVLALVGDEAETTEEATLDYEGALREILKSGGTTMRTLAEYRAAELGMELPPSGERPAEAPTMESIGKRLLDRARDVLSPDSIQGGPRRAPA